MTKNDDQLCTLDTKEVCPGILLIQQNSKSRNYEFGMLGPKALPIRFFKIFKTSVVTEVVWPLFSF